VDTLYIDYEGSSYPSLTRAIHRSGSAALQRLMRRVALDSASRRNPRTADYMSALADEGADSSQIVRIADTQALDVRQIAAAHDIVLLWRDGNGAGWSAIEQIVLRHKRPGCAVRVINGRRRAFELTHSVRRGFRLRRFLEKSLLPEAAASLAFVVVSPVLVVWDALRGRS
jgi:hypothetical protein